MVEITVAVLGLAGIVLRWWLNGVSSRDARSRERAQEEWALLQPHRLAAYRQFMQVVEQAEERLLAAWFDWAMKQRAIMELDIGTREGWGRMNQIAERAGADIDRVIVVQDEIRRLRVDFEVLASDPVQDAARALRDAIDERCTTFAVAVVNQGPLAYVNREWDAGQVTAARTRFRQAVDQELGVALEAHP